MAVAAKAESLPPDVDLPVPEASKGWMDEETMLNFIHQCELYFSLVFISNRFIKALFALRLL